MKFNLIETKNGTPLFPFYMAGAIVLAIGGYMANVRISELDREWSFMERQRIENTKKVSYEKECKNPKIELERKLVQIENTTKLTNRFDLQKVYSYNWSTHPSYKLAKEIHDSEKAIEKSCSIVNEKLLKLTPKSSSDYVKENFFKKTNVDYFAVAKHD